MSPRFERNLVGFCVGWLLGAGAFSLARAAVVIPAGTVVAMNVASCPTGWSAFADGAGRTIVGVGASPEDPAVGYSLLGKVGANGQLLQLAHLPQHRHYRNGTLVSEKYLRFEGTYDAADFASGSYARKVSNSVTGPIEDWTYQGVVDMRSPMVALLFCSLNADFAGDTGMHTIGVLGVTPAEVLMILMCIGVVGLYAWGFVAGQQR